MDGSSLVSYFGLRRVFNSFYMVINCEG
uniref:Uncharacterized protein n=1 Tax=Arundo donax TaxID=35708 RepID=A0A0A8Y621_ARUDO